MIIINFKNLKTYFWGVIDITIFMVYPIKFMLNEVGRTLNIQQNYCFSLGIFWDENRSYLLYADARGTLYKFGYDSGALERFPIEMSS